MKISNTLKAILMASMPLFLMAFNAIGGSFARRDSSFITHHSSSDNRLTIITDESWEVSRGQPKFGVYPLSIDAISAAKVGFQGGNAQAVVANFYGESTIIEGAKPIWLTKRASDKFESRQFKKVFMLRNNVVQNAAFKINCDDAARVYINGQLIGKELNGDLTTGYFKSTNYKQLTAYFYNQIFTYDVKPYLIAGALNTILIEVASEAVEGGHAYVSARLDIDFIENTIALKSDVKPVVKPIIKPEKKPSIVPKKSAEKVVVVSPEKVDIKTDPSVKIVENQLVIPARPIFSMEPTVFKTSNDVNVDKLRIGDIFELGNIYFKADDYQLNGESQGTLLELAAFLKANNGVKIEIGGHTNLVPTAEYAYKLSSDRAKSVMDFLNKNGVVQSRLLSKGYGKSKPKVMEKTTESNQKNQRVEVKILAK